MRVRLLSLAIFLSFSNSAFTKPIVLHCRDNDDLYAPPYTVSLDANALSVTITRSGDITPFERQQYNIQSVKNEDGQFSVTASNSILNSHIVVIATGARQIIYTDSFTDRPLAIDRCN